LTLYRARRQLAVLADAVMFKNVLAMQGGRPETRSRSAAGEARP
jgi:hypothetical protein